LKLDKAYLIEDTRENVSISLTHFFSSKYLAELEQDVILDRETRTSRRRNRKHLHVGFKGTKLGKAKWIKKGRVRELYPHLFVD